MMKLVLLAMVAMAAAQGPRPTAPVCLVDEFQWIREGGFRIHGGSTAGFDAVKEYFSIPKRFFRMQAVERTFGEKGEFLDIILFDNNGTLFEVEGKQNGGAVKCTKKKVTQIDMKRYCILNNATRGHPKLVGGEMVVADYMEERWSHHAQQMEYENIQLTLSTNIPIRRFVFLHDKTTAWDNYYDFGTSLPDDAMRVPAICPTEYDGTTTMEELKAKYDALKNHPFF
eukprot:NODE_5945_length_894_cov_74.346304_g5717_i0.p2 GENE.NODE_5945_length_894_cov_74.346304_g5717_i0~~NODE_5945_length_894_cov_74.346304_g5717_i0.p2  ORF type:complete len:227 (+),score=73.60 NODE_5945_length_894_cov_74.346304_g5717_i0:50-730(+)